MNADAEFDAFHHLIGKCISSESEWLSRFLQKLPSAAIGVHRRFHLIFGLGLIRPYAISDQLSARQFEMPVLPALPESSG
jgi:hypothetical protein